jgi:Helix-turn-helix domain of resolvase
VLAFTINQQKGVRSHFKEHVAIDLESAIGGRMSSALLQQTLSDLLAKQPATLEERAAIDAAIAAVVRGMQGYVPQVNATVTVTPAATRVIDAKPMPEGNPFYGLGLREACPRQLEMIRKPQLPREIWEVLQSVGYQTAHGDPAGAVHSALRRRAKTHGDVLLVGEGKWGLKSWYTEDDLEEIKKSVGGMGGRDSAAHSERTKVGMIVARPTKLPPEKIVELERMISEGKKVSEIARHFNIEPQTIYYRYRREQLAALRAKKIEEPESDGSGPPSQLRVVK